LNFPSIVKDAALRESLDGLIENASTTEEVPAYLHDTYDWAYLNPRNVALLDRNIVVDVLLFGNARRLMAAALKAIAPASRVFMAAHVYGDFVNRLANHVGPDGYLEIVDIAPIQVSNCNRKVGDLAHVNVRQADAAERDGREFDSVLSFFLLHEVPDGKKRAVMDTLLSRVPVDGTAVFVDYHRPRWWHPIRYVLEFVNNWLEPFAKSLWRQEISAFASEPDQFTWEKQTFFGGVYQRVVAKRRY
jgi:ubiquinone/menaquinone biosynthesis C-methylase UbiE